MSDKRIPKVGDFVVFHDTHGVPHNAILTRVWNPAMVNIVSICGDENKTDDYGRQIERRTSVNFKTDGPNSVCVHGNYARFPEDEPVPFAEPMQS